jgi:DNA-binding transcriptional LysR family regulator
MDAFDSRRADELATLLALHDQGSFAAAGRQLARHPTVLSKRLGALEQRLGIRLVERTTRQLRFTDEGERLVTRVREARRLIAEAEQEAAEGAAAVRGRLRLALPAAMGRRWLSGMLADFVLAYPQVTVEADYADRFVDLVGEGFDAAIRIDELADNRLVASKLCDHLRILCAAPEYLARYGEPVEPADLSQHNCLGFSGLRSFPEWRLTRDNEQVSVKISGSLRANDNEALLEAARRSVGILADGRGYCRRTAGAGAAAMAAGCGGWHLPRAPLGAPEYGGFGGIQGLVASALRGWRALAGKFLEFR